MSNSILGAGIIGWLTAYVEMVAIDEIQACRMPFARLDLSLEYCCSWCLVQSPTGPYACVFPSVVLIASPLNVSRVVLNAKMTGQKTYIDIMESCFGFPGRALVSFFQFSFAFGGMCAFAVILGDTIPRKRFTKFAATQSTF